MTYTAFNNGFFPSTGRIFQNVLTNNISLDNSNLTNHEFKDIKVYSFLFST